MAPSKNSKTDASCSEQYGRQGSITITREDLHKLIWTVSAVKAACQLGVSDRYVARICCALDVPRPPRGWWAKKGAGDTPAPPPLSPARPGHPLSWSKGIRTGTIGIFSSREKLRTASKAAGVHPLVTTAARIFHAAQVNDDGSQLITSAYGAMDLTTSPKTLGLALAFANDLFSALEARGHSVELYAAEWFNRPYINQDDNAARRRQGDAVSAVPKVRRPRFPTVATIGGLHIGLAILETFKVVEMKYAGLGQFVPLAEVKKKGAPEIAGISWTEHRSLPSGRIKVVAYSTIPSAPWQVAWRPKEPCDLVPDVCLVVSALEDLAKQHDSSTNRARAAGTDPSPPATAS